MSYTVSSQIPRRSDISRTVIVVRIRREMSKERFQSAGTYGSFLIADQMYAHLAPIQKCFVFNVSSSKASGCGGCFQPLVLHWTVAVRGFACASSASCTA